MRRCEKQASSKSRTSQRQPCNSFPTPGCFQGAFLGLKKPCFSRLLTRDLRHALQQTVQTREGSMKSQPAKHIKDGIFQNRRSLLYDRGHATLRAIAPQEDVVEAFPQDEWSSKQALHVIHSCSH